VTKRIYRFSAATCDGNAQMQALLGGKGANLAEMCQLGLPVPPGFTITTAVCNHYRQSTAKETVLAAVVEEALEHADWLAQELGHLPLLSVRSGAPVSMPGMMDTILNVGITTGNLAAWSERIGARAAADSQRRLIQMLATTAFGMQPGEFEALLTQKRFAKKVKTDAELDATALLELVAEYQAIFALATGLDWPDTLAGQLIHAIRAVFESWMSPRAIDYRKLNQIDDAMGTAVTVQAMVFGNMGLDSGSGVLFTRDPLTGDDILYGEFLQNAQGEDVVAGIRTPLPLDAMGSHGMAPQPCWSTVCEELVDLAEHLEQHYRDMLDLEFTVQQGRLWLLQCRTGKRSALAAFRIAAAMVEEGLIDKATALSRLTAEQYKLVRRPRIADGFAVPPAATGIAASPGVASGRPVFSAKAAIDCSEPCIMVTHDTCPDDIAGMAAAAGILTRTGGTTSHAAVVARAMDKPAVVGCTDLGPAMAALQKGLVQRVTIDGGSGRVWFDVEVPVVDGSDDPAVLKICRWAVERSAHAVSCPKLWDIDRPVRIMAANWWGNKEALEQVLHELEQLPDRSHVTLDLSPPIMFQAESDLVLQECFCQEDVAGMVGLTLDALQALAGRASRLEGLALVLAEVEPKTVAELTGLGFRLGVTPHTIADLLAGDMVACDADFIETVVGGSAAWQELQAVFAQAGRPVKLMLPAAPAEYLVFTQLGK
jgi:pyruvate,phosphate dikinase